MRVVNSRGEPFLRPGPVALLKAVQACGSLHRAAQGMKMSYSKAHRLIRGLEANLQRKLLVRQIGGDGGGGSTLTPFARTLIRLYEALESKVLAYSRREFARLLERSRGKGSLHGEKSVARRERAIRCKRT